MKKCSAAVAAAIGALALASGAWAHAEISPAVVQAKTSQVFTLAVPTEKENASTTKVELTPPKGFGIDSFVPAPGWRRTVQHTGSGEEATVAKVTWSGGRVPTGEDAAFSFLASADASKRYTFSVRQTYSDGSVVDWTGPESSETPAPTIEAKSSFGGGGGATTTTWVALGLAIFASIVAVAALFAFGEKRELA